VKPEDVKMLVKAYGDPSGIRATGLKIANDKFIVIRADDRSIYGKKVSVSDY
jgi:profilin